jgi:chromate transporter
VGPLTLTTRARAAWTSCLRPRRRALSRAIERRPAVPGRGRRLHDEELRQLLDAVAVGQVTPGPVFTTATFVGYVLGGAPGAGVATIGIFLPAFVFVALSGPLVPRLRRSRIASTVLDGVSVASLALMVVVTLSSVVPRSWTSRPYCLPSQARFC